VSAACLVDRETNTINDRLEDELDVIGLNEYFGWYDPDFSKLPALFENSNPQKPVVITEFGAGARAGQHGSKAEHFSEENQAFVYELQTETIRNIPYVRGMTPWILYDFRSPRRMNGFQAGYNRKGLLAEDRQTRKMAFDVLQQFYQELAE
jgi:beta-glucuronidase